MKRSERQRQRDKPQMAANSEMPGQAETSSPKQQTPTLQQALGLAVRYHSAGQLPEAESIYRQVLQTDPKQPVALHYLGVISHQVGKNDIAVDLIKKALAIQSDYAEASYNLGNAFKELGKTDEALASYRKALDTNPDYAEAYNNLGVTLQDLGQLDEAVASYDKALATRPSYAEAHNNLGNALQDLGQLDEAIASYHKALAIKPDYAEAYSNLANALQGLRKLDEAIAYYHKALTINPDFSEAHSNLGVALQDLGQLDEAVASCQRALAVKPDYVEGYSNLSVVLQELGKLEEAVASCQKALAIKPDSAEVLINLGTTFQDLGMLKEAIASYQKALAIKPNDTEAGRNLLFAMLNVPGLSPGELFTEHLRFAEHHARDISKPSEELTNNPAPDRRLRVGYLSSDFWDHPVGRNILPMLSTHDRSEFEVFCYADVRRHDAITERFRTSVDHWLTISGKSDAEVARMVRADGIDVLVCLAGRYDGNRPLVCAHRAAPVQVSYHDGATSGLEEMDYLLTDKFLNPPDTKELFTEELYRLPVYHLYPPVEEAPLVAALPTEQTGAITFGSFNNPAKINEEVIHLWAEVMKPVSNSRLLLKYKNWYDQASLRASVVERFSAYGIGQNRIMFTFKADAMKEHLGRYNEVDIALDPFPFNGATTTFQALWMGVPVVSLAGETFMSRATGSILHPGDLGDLVVDTPESYVTCARDLAGDVARLRTLRATLRERIAASPLCNSTDHARSVEAAYRVMWQKWCNKHGSIP